FRPAGNTGGRRVREAVAIRAVQSADVVADPAAGGKAIHAVESTHTQESEVPVNKADLLAAFRDLSDDELAAVGLAKAGTTESTQPTYTARVVESRTTEAGVFSKTSTLGRLILRD